MKRASSISRVLPPTLQKPISLSKIAKIELRHPKHRSGFPSTRAFIQRYIPPMRYYNPSFLYRSVEVEASQKTSLVVFDGQDQEISKIEVKFKQTPEELLGIIQKIDQEYQAKANEGQEQKEEKKTEG